MAKKYKYSFARKKENGDGRGAILCAVVSFVLFLVCVCISFALEGNGGPLIGSMGVVAFLIAVYGMLRGLKSLMTGESGHKWAVIGAIAAGIAAIMWLSLFLLGLKLI